MQDQSVLDKALVPCTSAPSSATPCLPSYRTAFLLYVVGFVVLSWPWASGAVTIPWDAKAQFQPELQFMAASLAQGESPFWTPNLFAGWPQIADPQSLIFSPLHFALATLDATPSFREADLVTFAYLFAGGLGLMMFFRDRGWHAGGAAVAALIFAFGGSAASRLQHTSEFVSLSYLPIALWLLARSLERTSWPVGIAAGAVIGLMAIGRDQVAMLGLYLFSLYVIGWCIDTQGRIARLREAVLPLMACGVTAIIVAVVPRRFRDAARRGQQSSGDRFRACSAWLSASGAAADASIRRPVRRRRPEC